MELFFPATLLDRFCVLFSQWCKLQTSVLLSSHASSASACNQTQSTCSQLCTPATFILALTTLYLSYRNSLVVGPPQGSISTWPPVLVLKLINHVPVQIPFKALTASTLMLLHPPSSHTPDPVLWVSTHRSVRCQGWVLTHIIPMPKRFPPLHSSMSSESVVVSPPGSMVLGLFLSCHTHYNLLQSFTYMYSSQLILSFSRIKVTYILYPATWLVVFVNWINM